MLILTINGVEQYFHQSSLSINESVHGRGVSQFVVQSPDASYRPARNVEVTITDGVTSNRLFGGLVESVTEQGIGNEPIVGIEQMVDCIDFNAYADWRHVINGGFVEGTTLLAALTSLLGYLSPYGVTLDPAQPTGPTLPHLPYDVRSISSILDEFTVLTGWLWEINYFKVLRMYLPGLTAAPFNVVDYTEETSFGDIVVEPANTEADANYLIGRFGQGVAEIIDTFTADGTTTAFAINYFPLVAHRGYVNLDGAITGGVIFGGENQTLSIGGGGTWDYSPVTGVVTSLTPVASGRTINFQYTAQFPVTVTATSGASPRREVVILFPDIFDRVAAQQAIDAQLAGYTAQLRLIRYSTFGTGLRSGMSQTITVAKRSFNAVCFITELTSTHLEGGIVRYDVVALEGDLLQNSWRDVYREWAELGGGGSVSIGGGVTAAPPAQGPAQPNLSVQFNLNNVFGGDAPFTYDPATNCIVCGELSSIDAEVAESCQAFGYDCHIG